MEGQNVLIWVIVALFIAFGCGCITEENMSVEKIAINMVEKQKEIHDMSHTEILTVYIGNESRTVESIVLYKKQNMFKRIEKVNSSTNSIVVSNGTIVSIYIPQDNMVMMLNESDMDFVQEPSIYAKFIDNMLDNYTVEYNGTESINGRNAYRIKLVPKIQNPPGNWNYWLWIDSEIWLPSKIQTYGDDRLLMTLEYRNIKINTGISDVEFEFEIPEGVRVIGG